MAVVGPPIWQTGVWADTVWAAGVWREPGTETTTKRRLFALLGVGR
jgi:hypothetical protein